MRILGSTLTALAILSLATVANATDVVSGTASTTSELVNLVHANDAALSLLSKHFSMDNGAMLNYLSSLKKDSLQTEGLYTVYTVEDGVLTAGVEDLKKGDVVFEDATGAPILVAKGLNPIASNAPVAGTGDSVATTSTRFVPSASTLKANSSVSTATTFAVSPALQGGGAAAGASGATSAIAIAAGVAGVLLIADATKNSEPVPEPATIAVMTAGLVGIASRRFRRDKKS